MTYQEFLDAKARRVTRVGFRPDAFMADLFPFHRDIVTLACQLGRFCVWADCGMGKTPMQLEWAQQVVTHTSGRVLILAPTNPQYAIDFYTAGDGAACTGDPTRARIHRCRLASSRPRIVNAALAIPEGIADADIEAQIVTDAASMETYGTRSWSAENLLTWYDELNGPFGGTAQDEANAATRQFAEYYVANYAEPQIRVEELTFASRAPDWDNAEATWGVICNADISDMLTLSVTNPGIALDDVDYFIEGVRMEIEPLNGDYALVRKSLDLSPRAYWATGF